MQQAHVCVCDAREAALALSMYIGKTFNSMCLKTSAQVQNVWIGTTHAHALVACTCWSSSFDMLCCQLQIDITGQRMTPDEDVGLYGRSVTFVPASPALPAPFR